MRAILSALMISVAMPALAADPAPEAEAKVSLPAITVTTVEKRELTDRVFASGMIYPVETVQVAPLIDGQAIDRLDADVGDAVEAGQVLAVLSDSTLELTLSQARASRASAVAAVSQAEAQLVDAQATRDEAVRVRDRTRTLAGQGAATKASVDTAAASATSAEAKVNVAQQSLAAAKSQIDVIDSQIADAELRISRTQVKAPVAGVITQRNAMIGAIATSAQPMFTMIKGGALELRAQVAEQDVRRLAKGQKVEVRLVGERQPVAGTVRLVEPTVDLDTRLGTVRISLNDSAQVRSGMYGDATIIVTSHDALAIPLSAIGGTGGGESVMRVEDGVVHATPVTLGIRDSGYIEVIDPLKAGDTIVAKAGGFVRDGDRIHPMTEAEAKQAAQVNQ